MTLIFIDGFDFYGTDGADINAAMEGGMWADCNGVLQETTSANVRTGRGAIDISQNSFYARTRVFASASTFIVGFGWARMAGGVVTILGAVFAVDSQMQGALQTVLTAALVWLIPNID